jgi:hypothetical protein
VLSLHNASTLHWLQFVAAALPSSMIIAVRSIVWRQSAAILRWTTCLHILGRIMADQLAAATRFPQDAFISLDEETHVYTVYGQQIQLSVTGVVESVYPVFDDEQVLASMRARGSIQRSSVYQGMTNAEISRKWRANAADAARFVHSLLHIHVCLHALL